MFLSIMDFDCPLRWSSYMGDAESVFILLQSGSWREHIVEKALALASAFGHERCVQALLKWGVNVLESEAVAHACIQGHDTVVEMLLEATDSKEECLEIGISWVIHMNNERVLALALKYCPGIANNEHLYVAITSGSHGCFLLLIESMRDRVNESNVEKIFLETPDWLTDLKNANWPQHIMTRMKRDRPDIYEIVIARLVKRRWRQIRAVKRIWEFWINFTIDYYSPGADNVPPGKGYIRTRERFFASLPVSDSDDDVIMTSQ